MKDRQFFGILFAMVTENETIFISELFSSIQGETSLQGVLTTFIRLSGCNLRCSWCDSKYSYTKGTPFFITDIIERVDAAGFSYVCITGGEPLMQPSVYTLMHRLLQKNYILSLETNGSFSISDIPSKVHVILDVKCPSSGQEKANRYSNLDCVQKKDEVKFVINDRRDFDFANNLIEYHNLIEKTNILFSPVWGTCDPKHLVTWMLEKRMPVRLNMQLHKFIWGKDVKGV